MNMAKVKTAELSGKALAWATWLADRGEPGAHNPKTGYIWTALNEHWSPHSDWSQGGPLIEKNDWALPYRATARAHLGKYEACTPGGFPRNGNTPLIAACRAIVAANLGDVVSVPEELVQQQEERGGKA